jgi:hypothetical protein
MTLIYLTHPSTHSLTCQPKDDEDNDEDDDEDDEDEDEVEVCRCKLLTHSLPYSLTYSLTYLLTYSLTYLLILTHLITHSFSLFNYSLTHNDAYLSYSPIHSLTCQPKDDDVDEEEARRCERGEARYDRFIEFVLHNGVPIPDAE